MTQIAPTDLAQPAAHRLIETAFPALGADGPFEAVALVTIERPDALNALTFDLLDELADALEGFDRDPTCRVIVLTVAGTSGLGGFNGDGGLATAAKLFDPSGVAVNAAGDLWIADLSNNRIRKVEP